MALREHPDRVVGALSLIAICAAACGIALDWRLRRATSQSLRDPLTGLPNRVLLEDRLDQALQRSRRSGEPFALILVDLDNFKDVNDVRGHRAGDAVLRALAKRFEAIVRSSDTVARIGGDEFVVLSIATADDDQAAALVGRLRQALRRPFHVDGSTVEIDGSIGWAVFPEDGDNGDELLAAGRRPDVRDEARHDRRDDHAPARRRRRASSATSSRRSSTRSSSSSTSRSSTSPRAPRVAPRRSSGDCFPTRRSCLPPSSCPTSSARRSRAS